MSLKPISKAFLAALAALALGVSAQAGGDVIWQPGPHGRGHFVLRPLEKRCRHNTLKNVANDRHYNNKREEWQKRIANDRHYHDKRNNNNVNGGNVR
jgi:hypothetical protein